VPFLTLQIHEPVEPTLEKYKAQNSIDFNRKSQPLSHINLGAACAEDLYKSRVLSRYDE
jgi:hypothetical protein